MPANFGRRHLSLIVSVGCYNQRRRNAYDQHILWDLDPNVFQ